MTAPHDQALIYAVELHALYEAEREKSARLKTLLDIGLAIASPADDLNQVVVNSLRRVMAFSGHDGGAVLLYTQDRRRLIVAATYGADDDSPGAPATEQWREVARLALQRRRPIYVTPLDRDADAATVYRPDWASLAVVPLTTAKGGKLGILRLTSSVDPVRLDTEDLQTLQTIAWQLSTAIENARLYAALQARQAELQLLLGKILHAQEEERRQVAYDLHDGLLQMLVASHQALETAVALAESNPAESNQWLVRGRDLLKQSIGDGRKLIAGLRPSALDDYGLIAALRAHLENIGADANWEIELEDGLGAARLPTNIEVTLYRIAQEALNNIRKHAQTRRVEISISRTSDTVTMEVRDWGKGFDLTKSVSNNGVAGGVGLAGMEERAALVGGKVTVHSRPKRGTRVRVDVPIKVGLAKPHGGQKRWKR